jgi:replicative DNA helicase
MSEDGGLPLAPPQNLEAERELLGSLLAYYRPDLLAATDATVIAEDFYRQAHGIVYRAIRAVGRQGDHVDGLTVGRFLECQRDPAGATYLERVGGQALIEFLVAHAVPHGVAERARIVHEDGEWRRRLRRLYEAQAACHARDERAYQAALADESPRLRVIPGGQEARDAV